MRIGIEIDFRIERKIEREKERERGRERCTEHVLRDTHPPIPIPIPKGTKERRIKWDEMSKIYLIH